MKEEGEAAVGSLRGFFSVACRSQELDFFHGHLNGTSAENCLKIFVKMVPEVGIMFPQVECLLRTLLFPPASSCVAEGSHRTLRGFIIIQRHFNRLRACNVHGEFLALLNPQISAPTFVKRMTEIRYINVLEIFEVWDVSCGNP